ncbi:uncharacterized protein LOC111623222 isoform X2 [Centruroides sculpturatus]|uniref:uncharacterized protein LOC111623222 isoform X2 n=1 Tax=Centruroides sculpturatus TaxID=218467 RepID=UPI000C6CB007|nr:uncharacterized protein LOC111623222 isoform X2 [Centruroides sculpturatus]
MEVTGFVGFGDIKDIFLKKNTQKKLHIVKIVHHEDISPKKIDEYLMKSDVGINVDVLNYMNKYNWMSVRNWGFPLNLFSDDESSSYDESSSSFDSIDSTSDQELSDDSIDDNSYYDLNGLKRFLKCYTELDEEDGVPYSDRYFEYCFFVNDENLLDTFYIEEEKLIRIDDEKVIGYIFKITNDKWNYGCLFQDRTSGKYFAMVLEEMYTSTIRMEDDVEHVCENEKFQVNFDDFCI